MLWLTSYYGKIKGKTLQLECVARRVLEDCVEYRPERVSRNNSYMGVGRLAGGGHILSSRLCVSEFF